MPTGLHFIVTERFAPLTLAAASLPGEPHVEETQYSSENRLHVLVSFLCTVISTTELFSDQLLCGLLSSVLYRSELKGPDLRSYSPDVA